jgi:pimeloyl-ACP methyl ester carboxylesterase
MMTRVLDRPDARICYARCGEGVPVLLVQGAGVVGEGWRPQREALRARHTVVSFDNRGIGRSTFDGRRLTVEAMAADALAIADAEGLDRFHVAGHSMGGLIAQQIALTAAARVLSLALLCSFRRGREAARMTPAMIWTALRTRLGSRAMRRRAFARLVMPDAYLRQAGYDRVARDLAPLFGRDLAEQPAIVVKQVAAMARFDASVRLAELARIPTLVIAAAHDRIAPARVGRSLAASIPGSRYVEVPDAGHGVTIQRADFVNRLLEEHFHAACPQV